MLAFRNLQLPRFALIDEQIVQAGSTQREHASLKLLVDDN